KARSPDVECDVDVGGGNSERGQRCPSFDMLFLDSLHPSPAAFERLRAPRRIAAARIFPPRQVTRWLEVARLLLAREDGGDLRMRENVGEKILGHSPHMPHHAHVQLRLPEPVSLCRRISRSFSTRSRDVSSSNGMGGNVASAASTARSAKR